MTAYYNEIDKFAAQWLRNLVSENLIAPGDVDDRSIRDVQPGDLAGYTQCHFFAGIGIWSHALREARWADDWKVWTGSCPCQPFSQAGKRSGFDDERHLWPIWYNLIRECRPDVIFGEQVAGTAGGAWLDLVCADLEAGSYAVAPSVLCSAGVGAPNIRHRIYWMANAERQHAGRRIFRPDEGSCSCERPACSGASGCGALGDGLGNASDTGLQDSEPQDICGTRGREEGRKVAKPNGPFDPWCEFEWLACLDGKARPTQPGLFPLAPRNPGDVGIVRASGNAINAVLAREFITAAMDCLPSYPTDIGASS